MGAEPLLPSNEGALSTELDYTLLLCTLILDTL